MAAAGPRSGEHRRVGIFFAYPTRMEDHLESKLHLQELFRMSFVEPREPGDWLYANRGNFFSGDLFHEHVLPGWFPQMNGYCERTIVLPGGELEVVWARCRPVE